MILFLIYVLKISSKATTFYENSLETIGNTQACLDNSQTYILNLHVHMQNEVKDAIVSLTSKSPNSNLVDSIQSYSGEKASVIATKSYFGTIMDELNRDLEKFNIQINLIQEDQEIDHISANGAYDPSCELAFPVKERNSSYFSALTAKMNNSVGLHLSVYGCVYKNDKYNMIDIITNNNCGRVAGVMWDGSVYTKTLIKSAVIEALSGAPDAYATGYLTMVDRNSLCGYFEKCVGRSPTVHGQLINGKRSIRYIEADECETQALNGYEIH